MISKEINGKIYFFKFGLKYLTQLQDFLQNVEDQDSLLKWLFYLSINKKTDWEQVYAACPDVVNLILLSLFKSFNLEGSFEEVKSHILQIDSSQVESLYSILVGKVGVQPSEFYQMTPYEAELAYEGYLKKVELETNCNILAIREAFNKNATPFVLLEDLGYSKSSLEERAKTFKDLNILEENK